MPCNRDRAQFNCFPQSVYQYLALWAFCWAMNLGQWAKLYLLSNALQSYYGYVLSEKLPRYWMSQNFLWESYEKLTILCFDVKNELLIVGQELYLCFILCRQYFANFCKLSSGRVCWCRPRYTVMGCIGFPHVRPLLPTQLWRGLTTGSGGRWRLIHGE